MDFSRYVDWSMLSYSLDDMPRHGPFGRKRNAIAMLDQDHNDSIDRDEAKEVLTVKSDLRLRASFPLTATGIAKLEVTSVCSDLKSLIELNESTDKISVTGSTLRLTMSISDVRAARNQIPPQAFAMLDANNDGGLDEAEIPAEALREYSFEDLDQDGDDKLTLREINEGMSPKQPIWNVQVRARGAETPDGVFAWLDQNQDQYLSTREIHDAEDRLRAIESSDGSIKPADIPDSYLVQFVRGDPERDEQLFAATPRTRGETANLSDTWPRWAQSMDSNRDGEISRREFPGRSQQFDQLDKDSDGFIDGDELSE
jgi:Ca2+-binding EF-hand superfamily protein